jgi:hypothetical protein
MTVIMMVEFILVPVVVKKKKVQTFVTTRFILELVSAVKKFPKLIAQSPLLNLHARSLI